VEDLGLLAPKTPRSSKRLAKQRLLSSPKTAISFKSRIVEDHHLA
jgi:hypothetical protein